jgi:hypothetical protein
MSSVDVSSPTSGSVHFAALHNVRLNRHAAQSIVAVCVMVLVILKTNAKLTFFVLVLCTQAIRESEQWPWGWRAGLVPWPENNAPAAAGRRAVWAFVVRK